MIGRVRYAAALGLATALGGAPAAAGGPEVGTVVTAEHADDVAPLALPGVVAMVRRGMRLEIGAARPVRWRRVYAEATEQHASQTRLGPHGELLDYVAGLPFPGVGPDDPDAGTKMMWNNAFAPWRADDTAIWGVEWQFGKLTAGRPLEVVSQERNDGEHSRWLAAVGRTEVDPRPALPEGAKGVRGMEVFGPTLPVLLTMLRSGPMLTVRYLDTREDDVWYYLSWNRKAMRISPQVRYDATGGVVADLNSTFGFNGPVPSYTWKVVGERELLGVVHAGHYPAVWCPDAGDFAPCDVWERRTAYVVEGTPRRAYDIYGKRVIALDKQSWIVLATDLHDKDGKLWKTAVNFWSYRPDPHEAGAERPYLVAGSYVDHQHDEANRWRLPGTRPLEEAVVLNGGLAADRFTTAAIADGAK